MKYREVKVQTSRQNIINTQYSMAQGGEGVLNTIHGNASLRHRITKSKR